MTEPKDREPIAHRNARWSSAKRVWAKVAWILAAVGVFNIFARRNDLIDLSHSVHFAMGWWTYLTFKLFAWLPFRVPAGLRDTTIILILGYASVNVFMVRRLGVTFPGYVLRNTRRLPDPVKVVDDAKSIEEIKYLATNEELFASPQIRINIERVVRETNFSEKIVPWIYWPTFVVAFVFVSIPVFLVAAIISKLTRFRSYRTPLARAALVRKGPGETDEEFRDRRLEYFQAAQRLMARDLRGAFRGMNFSLWPAAMIASLVVLLLLLWREFLAGAGVVLFLVVGNFVFRELVDPLIPLLQNLPAPPPAP